MMIFGKSKNTQKITGNIVLMTRNVLDFNVVAATASVPGAVTGLFGALGDVTGSVVDNATSIFGHSIVLRLISATKTDEKGHGRVGKEAAVQNRLPTLPNLGDKQDAYKIEFEYDADFGIPGAFYIKSFSQVEFFLVSLTLEDFPNHGTIHFVCNSWIYNFKNYNGNDYRIFFSNDVYVPSATPAALVKYRNDELKNLRGDGKGERKEADRIYDYDVYNDLGNPDNNGNFLGIFPDFNDDNDNELARPVLGGPQRPYPRRCRTGRRKTRKEPDSEVPTTTTYVPRDEIFGHLKSSDFLTYGIKSLTQNVLPWFKSALGFNNEFNSFDDVRDFFEGGIYLPTDIISKISPLPVLKEIFRTDGEQALKFPPPHIIKVSKSAWMTDEEFGREMIAGVNPNVIKRLEVFPPKSSLDPSEFGDHTSKITKESLEINLEGLTVDQALEGNRLFILDYHDAFMPKLKLINERKVNKVEVSKAYATRTILFLKNDGTLKPLAIELSVPHPAGPKFGVVSRVVLPAKEGAEGTIWLLAKAYVIVNDSCYHQLMSHWLNTHAVMEPFIIATNRNLSVLHPIHKLLEPHYRDTMNINALARQALINAGGIIEQSFLPGPYSVEMSSEAYKNWVFPDQALPADLIKRGLAVEDPGSTHGVRLLIEDYPYAVDGLEIWDAIKTWVQHYVTLYYASDVEVRKDSELQAWWKEAVERGHEDLKGKLWWPKMQTLGDLVQSCSIIIWTGSALHAAVNFGQYPYGGLILNRPTMSRRLIPEPGDTKNYQELETNPQKAYLRTITRKLEALVDLSVIEILSRHASDEVYLGQRDNPNWTSDTRAIQAFQKFGTKLKEIEAKIDKRNKDPNLRNRNGPAEMPYTVLLPTSEEGLTFRGIPNSISI